MNDHVGGSVIHFSAFFEQQLIDMTEDDANKSRRQVSSHFYTWVAMFSHLKHLRMPSVQLNFENLEAWMITKLRIINLKYSYV